jgi:N-acetylmuramoyl-L-alanine amidase
MRFSSIFVYTTLTFFLGGKPSISIAKKFDIPFSVSESTLCAVPKPSIKDWQDTVPPEFTAKGIEEVGKMNRLKKIVLDAGHGGKDSGCLGENNHESKITLKITTKLGALIEQYYPNIEVIYTREKDKFVNLDKRAEIANQEKADLFISIHCNYLPGHSSIKGTEVYVLSLERTKENLEIAKRENASVFLEDGYQKRYGDFEKNSNENLILASMVQSSNMQKSSIFAQKIINQVKNHADRPVHGVKQAGFLVLRQSAMPSVLIETGYLSNQEEEDFLSSSEGQSTFAMAVFKALQEYKETIEGSSHTPLLASNPITFNNRKKHWEEPIENSKSSKKIFDDDNKPSTTKENVVEKEEKRKKKTTPIVVEREISVSSTKESNKTRPSDVDKETIAFYVQLSASDQKENTREGKWKDTGKITLKKEGGLYKYLSDDYRNYNDANQESKRLKNLGFGGAFVVAYRGDKRINLQEAMK